VRWVFYETMPIDGNTTEIFYMDVRTLRRRLIVVSEKERKEKVCKGEHLKKATTHMLLWSWQVPYRIYESK
jgi:hypothetical protein